MILVSDWEDERGHSAHGRLELWPTDTLHQFYVRGVRGLRRYGDRLLWGAADIQFKHITIPRSADPASRDPDNPGVLLHSSGQLELGVWRGLDGFTTTLTIKAVAGDGFRGTWGSDLGLMRMVSAGRALPNPHGHFCALRR